MNSDKNLKSLEELRKAETLDDAALNPDGTYNGANALAWLSDILTGGKGIPANEIKDIFDAEKAKKGLK